MYNYPNWKETTKPQHWNCRPGKAGKFFFKSFFLTEKNEALPVPPLIGTSASAYHYT